MWRRNPYVYRYPDGGAGTGDGGAAAAGAGAAGAGSSGASGQPAGAGTGTGAGAPASGTLLAQAGAAGTGAAAAAAASAADPNAWLPEKFRVFDGDGDAKKLNVEASAKKLAAEGYAPLEKRMGDAGAPPEKPEGYKNEAVLETLKKAAKGADVKLPDEFVKELNAWAHGAKLTQAQRDAAVVAYVQGAQKMADTAFDNAMATAQADLVKVWGADGMKPDSPQMQAAYRAYMAYAPATLRTPAEMDKVGNNPVVLQILAAVGAEMKEDTRLHGEGGQGDDVQKLMNSEPYWNKKHAEHQSTVKKVNEFFARGGKVARAA